jgi:hypothetical protein
MDGRKDSSAQGENAAPSEAVAGRAPGQDQRAQHERVPVDDPLRSVNGHVQIRLNERQRDVDCRAVDERHAGAQDGRGQHPGLRTIHATRRIHRGENNALVARRSSQIDHRLHCNSTGGRHCRHTSMAALNTNNRRETDIDSERTARLPRLHAAAYDRSLITARFCGRRLVSLSEIKSEHSDGVNRRGLGSRKGAQQPE